MIYLPKAAISPVTADISIGGLLAYAQHQELPKFQYLLNVAWEVADSGSSEPLSSAAVVNHARLDDSYDVKSQESEIFRAVALVTAARRRGERVLVTCAQGRNRSGVVIAEHLIQMGMAPSAAVALLKDARTRALTNPAFVSWLHRNR